MAIKQKTVMLAMVLGLAISLSATMSGGSVFAQEPEPETIPQACQTDPESEECRACQDNTDPNHPACTPVPAEGDEGSEPVEETCDPAENTCCDKVKTSIISGDDICGTAEAEGGIIFGLLKWVLRIMTAGVGITAVGGIAYGALLYSSAENKPEQTKKAIGIITNVVIGILAYALMYVFLNYLIPGGVFL